MAEAVVQALLDDVRYFTFTKNPLEWVGEANFTTGAVTFYKPSVASATAFGATVEREFTDWRTIGNPNALDIAFVRRSIKECSWIMITRPW